MKINSISGLRIIAAILSVCLVFSSALIISPFVFADETETQSETEAQTEEETEDEALLKLQKQYDDIEKEIQKNKSALSEVQGDIKDNKKKLNKINGEIDDINSQISILDNRINTLDGNISSLEKKIKNTNNDIDDINNTIVEINQNIEDLELEMTETRILMQDTRELLMGRIRENYMAGEASTLEILFSSNDISSFFTRKELMVRVGEKDAHLINELTDKIAELKTMEEDLEAKKAELEDKKVELESKKVELGEQKNTLTVRKTDLKDSKTVQNAKKSEVTSKKKEVVSIINELDHNSAEYKAEIKKQEAEKEELSKQIDEYIRKVGSKQGDTPDVSYENDGKMAWPVKFESYITAGYPAYSNGSAHWGIDICAVGGNTRGRNFNAAQGGKVIIAMNDGQWNYGFGNYCVIDHGDGTQTLYAHSDNIKVHEGQVVKKGDVIGIVGATGNVTGPHLHFEVRVKSSDGGVQRVQPLNYVSNPYS